VSDALCPHCGQPHAPEVAFCPTTGRPVGEASANAAPTTPLGASGAAAADGVPDKGVADILKEAYGLYRTHARALLMTCALLFVPASLVKSCALSMIAAPAMAGVRAMEWNAGGAAHELESSERALQDAYSRHADGDTIRRLQAENARHLEEIARRGADAAGVAMGSFTLWMLSLMGTMITAFFLYGIILPLTNGALTISVADRVLGGSAGWREVWMLLFRRLRLLLSAVIPAALLVALGYACLAVPGMVLGLLFAFVSPVVLIEGLGGRAALRRSIELARGDWLRLALLIIVMGALCGLAQILAYSLIPSSAVFISSLLGDLIIMVLLPVPILGVVLLYFDIRRKREGFTDDRLRADLAALQSA
jgi:hypothetical protein